MRHRKAKQQLNRFTSWRKATVRSLARNVLIYQSIKTTKAKAKAVKPLIDRLISLARNNTIHARRQAFEILGDHKLVGLLFNDIAQRFSSSQGGFTRMLGMGARRGDNAELVILELTELKKKEKRKKKKEKEPEAQTQAPPEKAVPQQKEKTETAVKEKPPITKKPTKKFLGGLRKIFKKERDSL
jgi:large subunit ribosomal protein L17